MNYELNLRADRLCQVLAERAAALRIGRADTGAGANCFDFGIDVPGGLDAGCELARVCLADLASVQIARGEAGVWPGPAVTVRTDHPVAACMASQYAGWQITGKKYFGMGSGPMCAAAGREELFDSIGFRESPHVAVGVVESRQMPPHEVCAQIADTCRVQPENLTLLVAPTASLAGTVQVVARSVETALHKMHELGFNLQRVVSGFGVAPLPTVAGDDLAAIGRTNDAVLYGGQVTLWVRGDDASLDQVAATIPSCASPDWGQPFADIFDRYERDFYKIDPQLFSPAEITLNNLDTGSVFRAGKTRPDVLKASLEG